MAIQDSSSSSTKPPLFNGTNFSFWKIRMKTYLMSLGMEVWNIVVDGYKILKLFQLMKLVRKITTVMQEI
jgi:hypothetical protein